MPDYRSPGGVPPYSRPRESLGQHRQPTGGRPASRRTEPPRRSSPLLSVLLYGGVILLALAVAAGTFLVLSPPTDLIRREIIARVKAETGRELRINGPASFTLFPSLGLRLADVSLSPPPSMNGEPFLTAANLDIGVQLFPLLRQEIVVDRLMLDQPVFALRVDAEGRRSWDMAAIADDLPVRFAGSPPLHAILVGLLVSPAAAATQPAALSLNDISIENGTVRYSDERDGRSGYVQGINARFALPAMDKPLTGSGNLVSEGEALEFKTTLTNPADLIAERPAQLDLTLSGAPLSLHYEGSLALRDDVSAEGAISVNAPSLGAAARWFGVALSPEAGAGALAFSTQLSAAGSGVRLSAIDLKAGSMTATGSIGVEHQAPRPHIVADLKVSGFNLGAFTGESGGASVAPEVQTQPAAPAPSGPAEPPGSIEELLNRPGPQVKGFTQRSGWSQEPIELAALGWIDADARIAVSDTKLGQLHVDAADISIGLKDRVLKVTLADVKLYQGSGHGLVTLDATGADAAFTADASMSEIAARLLLNDTAQVDWLAGRANIALKIAGRGASEVALIQSLNGTANVAINNGAVIGFDLDAAMRQLSEGTIPDFELSPSLKTDFSQLTGSFVITNGIAKNDNLKLASPRLTGSGAGTVDLPQRSLDYTVKPKLVASAAAEGEQEAAGFEVPVHISGSWEKPDVTPDIQGALGNSKNLDAVKELGKSFKGKNAGEIVEDLFGKEEGKPSKAEKLLDKLFKQ